MNNLADIIEQFILSRLSSEIDDIIVLKRNELAEEIECAPSQISYVLSTRFTTERGFIVESRRGSGGFVRIARVQHKNGCEDAARQMEQAMSQEDLALILTKMQGGGMITRRETALIMRFFTLAADRFSPQERVPLLQDLFITLAQNS